MHLRNGNEQKRKKIKTFPNKMYATVFIFLQNTEFLHDLLSSACKIQIQKLNCQMSPGLTQPVNRAASTTDNKVTL